MGFDMEHLINGMGLAYSQCCTNVQARILDGAMTVMLQQGFGAKAGFLGVEMGAERGFTGARNVFEGTYGFYRVYARNEYHSEVITDQLGKRFEFVHTSLKAYPCCKHTHIPIYAALEMVKEHDLQPEEIEEIRVYTNSIAYNLTGVGENKYHPKTMVDAQFSLPYTVATAVVRRKIFIDDFTEESINDGEVLRLAQRVSVKVDPQIDKIPGLTVGSRVELKTRGGNRYSKYLDFVKGHPKNPMTMEECVEKFMKCVSFSAKPLGQKQIEQLIQTIGQLEETKDVRRIVTFLVGRAFG